MRCGTAERGLHVGRPRFTDIVLCAVLASLVAGDASAQNRRWYGPYKAGLTAIESGDWTAAVANLRTAAAVEPKCESGKLIEGVIREDYCPEIYLAKAYIGSRQFAKAERILNDAQSLPRVFSRMAAGLRSELTLTRSSAQFEAARDEALASLRREEFVVALRQLEALRSSHSTQFANAALGKSMVEAATGVATALVNEGQGLLRRSRMAAARAKFAEADSRVPGFEPARQGLTEIGRREAAYSERKAAALSALTQKQFDLALTELDGARKAHLEKYRADGLRSQLVAAATGSAGLRTQESVTEYGLARLRCDAACSVSIGAGPVWTIDAAQSQLVPAPLGTPPIVAYMAPGKVLWRSLVDVRLGQITDVAVPVRAELDRLAAAVQQQQRISSQLRSTRARVAQLRSETQALLAEANGARLRDEQRRTTIQRLVQRVTLLEAQIAAELNQAAKEERDADTAEANARNSLLGSSGFGRVLQGANVVSAVALRASAARRRRHAQEMLVEINRLTQELYRATVQGR